MFQINKDGATTVMISSKNVSYVGSYSKDDVNYVLIKFTNGDSLETEIPWTQVNCDTLLKCFNGVKPRIDITTKAES